MESAAESVIRTRFAAPPAPASALEKTRAPADLEMNTVLATREKNPCAVRPPPHWGESPFAPAAQGQQAPTPGRSHATTARTTCPALAAPAARPPAAAGHANVHIALLARLLAGLAP